MKLQWIALLAGVLLSAPLAAQNTVQTAPQEVRTPLYYLKRQLKVWKLDRIEPLSQTIPSPFAKGAWRASLTPSVRYGARGGNARPARQTEK